MWHFIKVYTIGLKPNNLQTKKYNLNKNYNLTPLDITMDYPKLIVSYKVEKPIRIQRVNFLLFLGSHNPELGMKCDVCERTFVDINSMMEHRKLHFDYDCFCSRCWQGFFDFLELETHIQTSCRYKEALYKCDVCGKKYSKLHAINKHIDTHPIHSPHVCRMCGRGFESEKDLKVHRIAAHIIRPYKCEFCQKTFKKRESLIDHRRVHLRVKLTSVSVVGVSVKDEDMEETETERETVKYECTLCGIVMPTENTFVQHMLGHSAGNEEHRCDHCEKVFFSRSLLIVHCRKEHKIFLSARVGTAHFSNISFNSFLVSSGKW